MPLYFAYGSNLLTARLKARCPSATPVGRAMLPGHSVAFAKESHVDGSAKATILPGAGQVATGVLFELNTLDQNVLDKIEGVGKGYDRLDEVEVVTGSARVSATTYIASAPGCDVPPWDWYVALMIAGALEHRLPGTLLSGWRAHRRASDPELDRPVRQVALAALAAAGHDPWHTLFQEPEAGRSSSN